MIRLFVIICLLGCGGEGEEDLLERTASASRAQRSSMMSGSIANDMATGTVSMESVSMESTSAMAAPPTFNDVERAALALDETVTDALAAAHAAEVGASLCDAAYESAAELVRVVRERFPDDARDLPPRELFTTACERMPENVQRCMLVRYAVEHQEECAQAQEALPAADRERMERLLGGE